MTTKRIRAQLNRLFSNVGGLDEAKRLLRFAQRYGTSKPSPSAGAEPLKMPSLADDNKGRGKR